MSYFTDFELQTTDHILPTTKWNKVWNRLPIMLYIGTHRYRQFFREIYPMMVASQSGFDLRFLIAGLCPRAMTPKEMWPFAEELWQTNLLSLNDLYKAINDDHQHGDIVYTLSDDALALYKQSDKQFCQKLNSLGKMANYCN